MGRHLSAILVALAMAASALGQCQSNGLTLAVTGGRLGDPFTVTLSGAPGLSGLLGIDVAGGPSPTPIGPLCLGLTPALLVLPFTFDPAGQFAFGGIIPALTPLIGQTFFLQAAAYDPSQPGGVAVSNNASLTLRQPRIFFIDPAYSSPLFGAQPGTWCAYDALTDVVYLGPIQLPLAVRHAVRYPNARWIAFLLVDGSVWFYDEDTGAVMLTIYLPPDSTGVTPIRIAIDGNILYALHGGLAVPGQGWTAGTPGVFSAWSIPSGTNLYWTQLTGGNPEEIMLVPSSGFAYLRDQQPYAPLPSIAGSPVVVVNLATGAELPPIFLGPSAPKVDRWMLRGSTLYCVMQPLSLFGSPPFINAIDTTTNLTLFPAPVALPLNGQATLMSAGPAGMLYVYAPNTPSQLMELHPATFQTLNSSPSSIGFDQMTLSPGGTELLMLCYSVWGIGCPVPYLQSVSLPTMTTSTVTPLVAPMAHLLVSLPSATLRRAFVVANGNVVLPFSTDPAVPPTSTVTLPWLPFSLWALVD